MSDPHTRLSVLLALGFAAVAVLREAVPPARVSKPKAANLSSVKNKINLTAPALPSMYACAQVTILIFKLAADAQRLLDIRSRIMHMQMPLPDRMLAVSFLANRLWLARGI